MSYYHIDGFITLMYTRHVFCIGPFAIYLSKPRVGV